MKGWGLVGEVEGRARNMKGRGGGWRAEGGGPVVSVEGDCM